MEWRLSLRYAISSGLSTRLGVAFAELTGARRQWGINAAIWSSFPSLHHSPVTNQSQIPCAPRFYLFFPIPCLVESQAAAADLTFPLIIELRLPPPHPTSRPTRTRVTIRCARFRDIARTVISRLRMCAVATSILGVHSFYFSEVINHDDAYFAARYIRALRN